MMGCVTVRVCCAVALDVFGPLLGRAFPPRQEERWLADANAIWYSTIHSGGWGHESRYPNHHRAVSLAVLPRAVRTKQSHKATASA